MTGCTRSHSALAAGLVRLVPALVLTIVPASAFAQATGTVEGQVTEFESGRALPGITVVIDGTDLRAQTNSSGWYRIRDVPTGSANLRIELEDYGSTVQPIIVESGGVTVAHLRLTGIAAILDELLVRASSAEPSNRNQGATMRELEPDIDGPGGKYSLAEMLRGRVPGLSVMQFNGQVGSGFRLLLRGINSISLDNEPLLYLDGILVSGPSRGQRGRASDVLNLLDPFSIDRIEVLSGPAASVRYGAGAANGVIMIYTKTGRQG